MPSSFMGQLSEEFLGMNVTQPLPFERSMPYAQPAGSSNNVQSSNAIASYVNKGTYNADDFVVNPVASSMELPDAIMSQLQLLSENGELEFGNSNVETMQHLQQSATNTDVASIANTTNITESSGGMQLPPEYYGNTRAQIDWFIKEQGSQSEKEIPDAAPDKKAANQNEIPQGMRVLEPLTAGDRFYYLRSQMWAAIQKKWQQNKASILPLVV